MERRGTGAGPADAVGERPGGAQVERSARLWLRAYPRRWRAAFGEDLVGLLVETGRPGARRLPAREVAAIVRAGWALRLREHPPLLRWLGYRLLDVRLPLRDQHWVVDDIGGRFYPARINAVFFVFITGWSWSSSVARGWKETAPFLVIYLVLVVVAALPGTAALWRYRRRSAWQRHVSPEVPVSLLARRDRARHPSAGLSSPA